jgi:hypothetical protein
MKIDSGLWSLWAKRCAVDHGSIVIHGKRPGSPQANCPQIQRPLVSVRQLTLLHRHGCIVNLGRISGIRTASSPGLLR